MMLWYYQRSRIDWPRSPKTLACFAHSAATKPSSIMGIARSFDAWLVREQGLMRACPLFLPRPARGLALFVTRVPQRYR